MELSPGIPKYNVSEIFSSLQGEGPYLGERHLFIRFPECNLDCDYCDEKKEDSGEFTLDEIVSEVHRLDNAMGPHSFVSFTGGEPLLYWPAVAGISERLKPEGYRIYLETNGVLSDELEKVLPSVDLVSMDIKLPSVTRDRACYEEHRRFLKVAVRKEVYVKIIISTTVEIPEFDQALGLIAEAEPEPLLVLQPVTADGEKPVPEELLSILCQLQQRALAKLKKVRIIPRLHKILEIH